MEKEVFFLRESSRGFPVVLCWWAYWIFSWLSSFCVWRHSGEAFSLPQTLYFYTFSFFVFMQQSAVIANLIHLRGVVILPSTVVVNLTWQPDNVGKR